MAVYVRKYFKPVKVSGTCIGYPLHSILLIVGKEVMNKVVLDVDTGEDDAIAILVALASKLPLQYVITSYGNSSIENTTRNTAAVLDLVNAANITVIRGSEYCLYPHPIEGQDINAAEFVGANGLCNVDLPDATKIVTELPDGDDFPTEVVRKLKRLAPVDYIVTGPCTNLARICLAVGQEIKNIIQRVVIMGGAVYHAGNSGPCDPIKGKQVAEFNFYCDPNAAEVVLRSGLSICLVPWDTTHNVVIQQDEVGNLQATGAIGIFALQLINGFFDCYGAANNRAFELNDPLAVLAYLGYGHVEKKTISILQDVNCYGQSVLDSAGSEVDYFVLSHGERRDLKKRLLILLGMT